MDGNPETLTAFWSYPEPPAQSASVPLCKQALCCRLPLTQGFGLPIPLKLLLNEPEVPGMVFYSILALHHFCLWASRANSRLAGPSLYVLMLDS